MTILIITLGILALIVTLSITIIQFKWAKVLLSLLAAGVFLFAISWIKDTYFTSPFDHWYYQAQTEYNNRTFWANEPCPEAVACYSKALDVWVPSNGLQKKLAALSQKAHLLKLAGENKEAISSYTSALEINPENFRFYEGRGTCFANLEKYDLAIANLGKALALTESLRAGADAHYKSFAAPDQVDRNRIYLERGMVYSEKQDFPTAILDFSEVIKQEPAVMKREPPTGHDGIVGAAYYQRGKAYNRSKQYDKAIQDFSKCIAFIVFVYPDAYRERGYAYNQSKQYKMAISDFNKAIEKETFSPYKWFIFHERAFAYERLRQINLANQDNAEADKYQQWVSGKTRKRVIDLSPN